MKSASYESLNNILRGEGSIKKQQEVIKTFSVDYLEIVAASAPKGFARKFAQMEIENRKNPIKSLFFQMTGYFIDKFIFPIIVATIIYLVFNK